MAARFTAVAFAVFSASAAVPSDEVFEKNIRPLLVGKCGGCHNPKVKTGGLDLTTPEGLRAAGRELGFRQLIDVVRWQGKVKMPPSGQLPAAEIHALERWVENGAPLPAPSAEAVNPAGDKDRRAEHWSFQPFRKPGLPTVKYSDRVRNEIDCFIIEKLEQAGLAPPAEAGKATLLRRATFDLHGLPPAAEEIQTFLADNSPDAYERVIEKLLASPRYGERWGRHWLDVARFAETSGIDENVSYRDAWRYREYVIDSFSRDLPVDRNNLATMMVPFDFADSTTSTGQRGETYIAPQAMYFMNNDFFQDRALTFAKRLLERQDLTDRERIQDAVLWAWGRPVTAEETDDTLGFLAGFPEGAGSQGVLRAWISLCRVPLESNNFALIDLGARMSEKTRMRPPLSRRALLRDAACGFGAVSLAALLAGEQRLSAATANPLAARQPHFAPRAKRVIFVFMSGGPSPYELEMLAKIDRRHARLTEFDDRLESRIQNFELAFRMQAEAPEVFDVDRESDATRKLYGLDKPQTADFAWQCLLARRLVERGVRFVQCTADGWDQHTELARLHAKHAMGVDKPIAGLLRDLKSRGMLDDTLVIWGGEFGRTPFMERDGRDHNPYGFTMWMAGGGVRPGFAHGATDDYGYRAVERRMHIHDLHATILHLLGLDHTKLTYRYNGRDFRLTDVHGVVPREILL